MHLFFVRWILFILMVFNSLNVFSQCQLPFSFFRWHKQVNINKDPIAIFVSIFRNVFVSENATIYTDTSEIVLGSKQLKKINQKINNQLNTEVKFRNTNFKMKFIYRVLLKDLKVGTILKEDSAPILYYCKGTMYLEKNVLLKLDLITDTNFNLLRTSFEKIKLLRKHYLSICDGYNRIKSFDSTILSLDIDYISYELENSKVYLKFDFTDYWKVSDSQPNHQEIHFKTTQYEIDLMNNSIIKSINDQVLFNCG